MTSHIFSLNKITKTAPLWIAATFGSILAVQFMPTATIQLQQNQAQIAQFESNQPQSNRQLNQQILLLMLAATGGFVVWKFLLSARSISTSKNQQNTSTQLGQANHKQRKRLLSLLHDDIQAANRLIAQAQRKYPQKSSDWYMEKVIYDLQRDRGA